MRAPLVAAVVLVAALAGCGGGGSQDKQVRGVATKFLNAVRAGEGAKACDQLTPNGRDIYGQLGDVPCEQGVTQAALPPNARITAVTVKGDDATVELTDPQGVVVQLIMKKRDGAWKVDRTG